ncbi:MAG: hypothetical protein K2K82_05490 [Muribaculaceae bacterium]|nr:hypothetical protein [Muribaculaceae bacterium]
MAKTSGGVRNVPIGSTAYNNRLNEVAAMRASGKYSSVEMAENGTGWVAIENSLAKHKPEEIEAARILANHGYKVTLGDEAGDKTVSEGKLFLSSYEQRTPDGKSNTANNIKNALGHGRDKQAKIAVIYQKNGKHTREQVEQGIRDFEATSKYRFQRIIIVTRDGRLHHHLHNN